MAMHALLKCLGANNSVCLLGAAAALISAGCGDMLGAQSSDGPSFGQGGGRGVPENCPGNIADFLRKNCQDCHSNPPAAGAPMPMMTLSDLHAPSRSTPSLHVFELLP